MIPYNEKIWGVHPREITAGLVLALRAAAQPGAGDRGRGRRRAARDGLQPELPLPEVGRHRDVHARAADADAPRGRVHTRVQPRRGRLAAARGDRRRRALHVPRAGGDHPAARAAEADDRSCRPRSRRQAARLRCTTLRYLNIGARGQPPADWHWIYVPETAVSVLPRERVLDRDAQHGARRAARRSASRWPTAGRSPTRPCATRRRRWSRRARSATSNDVVFAEPKQIEYAYVVFDQHYYEATRVDLRVPGGERDLPARPLRRLDLQRDGGLRARRARGGGADRSTRPASARRERPARRPTSRSSSPSTTRRGSCAARCWSWRRSCAASAGATSCCCARTARAIAPSRSASELEVEHPQVRMLSVGEPNYGLAMKQGILEARGST